MLVGLLTIIRKYKIIIIIIIVIKKKQFNQRKYSQEMMSNPIV